MNSRLRVYSVLILTLCSAIAALPGYACAATTTASEVDSASSNGLLQSFSTSFDVTAASRYMFQGFDYSDGRCVLQPNLVANLGPFSAVCWANYQSNLGDVNEVDLSLKTSRSFGRLSVSPGYTVLRYPNRDWSPSQELFADLSLTAPFSPSLSIHGDFDAGDGIYATLALSHSLGHSLSAGTNIYYQRNYYGMTGVPSVELKVSTGFPYAGVNLTTSLSRFATWNNGNFVDAARLPQGWVIAINMVPGR